MSVNQTAQLLRQGDADIVYNCSFWDKLGVGYMSHDGKLPQRSTLQTTLDQVALTTWRPIYTRAELSATDSGFSALEGFGFLASENLDIAVAQVARDAAWLLDQQVAAELATTDSTKTVHCGTCP
jgi:hypothetical protein